MIATKHQCKLLVRGEALTQAAIDAHKRLARDVGDRVNLCTEWPKTSARSEQITLVVSPLTTVHNEIAEFRAAGPTCKLVALMDGLPAESIPEYLLSLQVRTGDRVHLAAPRLDAEVRGLLGRCLQALAGVSAGDTIIDAWWEFDQFLVLSQSFQRLRLPLGAFPRQFRKAARATLEKFEIDEYGEFVYWPKVDVHLGWDQFAQATDPMAKLRAEQKSDRFNAKYGIAIRRLRESCRLLQSEIDGLDERTVRRIEQGETRATSKAIEKLAKAHRMNSREYMSAVAELL